MNLKELSPDQMEAIEFAFQEFLKSFPIEHDDSLHQSMNRFVWDIYALTIEKMRLKLEQYGFNQADYFAENITG